MQQPRATAPSQRRTTSTPALALALLVAVPLGACAGVAGPKEIVIVDEQKPAEPKLDFGTLSLRMPLQQLQSLTAEGGWVIDGTPADEAQLALTPPAADPAKRYEVILEAGRVVQLVVDFKAPDDKRVDLRHSYPISRVQPDGEWAMTDAQRRTLVVIAPHGARIVAIHLASARDQKGVRAALHRYLGE
jgi:hypothetical protein